MVGCFACISRFLWVLLAYYIFLGFSGKNFASRGFRSCFSPFRFRASQACFRIFTRTHTPTHPHSHTLTHIQPALRTLRTLRSGKLLAPNFTYTTVATIRACTVLRFRRRRAADPAVYPHIYRRSCGPVANHRSKHVSKKWPIQSYIEACVAAGPITYPSRYRRSCGPVANCAVVDDSDVSSRAFSITYPCFGSGHITPSWQVLSG